MQNELAARDLLHNDSAPTNSAPSGVSLFIL
jgi:hypothetical protein